MKSGEKLEKTWMKSGQNLDKIWIKGHGRYFCWILFRLKKVFYRNIHFDSNRCTIERFVRVAMSLIGDFEHMQEYCVSSFEVFFVLFIAFNLICRELWLVLVRQLAFDRGYRSLSLTFWFNSDFENVCWFFWIKFNLFQFETKPIVIGLTFSNWSDFPFPGFTLALKKFFLSTIDYWLY